MSVHSAINPSQTPVMAGQRFLAWIQKHPLATYFILAFAGSWLCLLPLVLGNDGIGLFNYSLPTTPFSILMPFLGPALAALVTTAMIDGKAGVGRLLRRYLIWRVGVRWYLLVLLGPVALLLLAAAIFFGLTPLVAILQQWPLFFTFYLANLPLTLLLGGPLGEELGWRGFALPRMQRRYGPLAGTLWLGLLHGLWHLPLYFIIEAYAPFTLPSFALFILGVLFNAIIWTWVFNNTQGSLLIMTLLHAAVNMSGGYVLQLIPTSPAMAPYLEWIPIIAYGGCALLLIILTRAKLSYVTVQEVTP